MRPTSLCLYEALDFRLLQFRASHARAPSCARSEAKCRQQLPAGLPVRVRAVYRRATPAAGRGCVLFVSFQWCDLGTYGCHT
eukprot:COSAG06_NODE_10357_length_1695_cov_3.461153_2_plen_82_part_00